MFFKKACLNGRNLQHYDIIKRITINSPYIFIGGIYAGAAMAACPEAGAAAFGGARRWFFLLNAILLSLSEKEHP
jgi:hypothetical protein